MGTTLGDAEPSWSSRMINGSSRDVLTLSHSGMTIEAIELDLADQWDFMEIAGAQIDNPPWVATAMLAASVISIDGVPQPPGLKSRDAIRAVLRRIGSARLDALDAELSRRNGEMVEARGATVAEHAAGN